MFQYVTSLFASNTKKSNTVIYVATTRTKKVSRSSVYFKGFSSEKNSEKVEYFEEDTSSTQLQEEISSTQLRRQNKQQQLIQKLLQGKISYQEIMNNYAQPLSQVQEDLEDDDISSTQSQRQKKQQDLIQRILQGKISYQEIMNNYAPLSRAQENLEDDDISSIQLQRQEKQQELIQKLLLGEVSYQTIVNNYAQIQENRVKDYDVWDDELIGHLMNLIDTVGIETN